jgi:trk system potassium uptake protein TrkA
MFVLIVGGGRTGTQLARFMISQNHQVHVIENRPSVLAYMHREIPTETILEGNPIDPRVLEQAGIRQADVLAAVTRSDEENLISCYFARANYQVPRTIARVNNPRNAWLFNRMFYVDVAVNATEIMAQVIEEEMSMGEMMTLVKLKKGNYSLVEEKVLKGAPAIGTAIKNLGLSDQCVIAAIIRNGQVIVPRGDMDFEVGDEVLAVTDKIGAGRLCELLEPVQENIHKSNGKN